MFELLLRRIPVYNFSGGESQRESLVGRLAGTPAVRQRRCYPEGDLLVGTLDAVRDRVSEVSPCPLASDPSLFFQTGEISRFAW